MERKQEALRLITTIVKDEPTANLVLERLQDEGFLHLGYGKADVDRVVGTFKELFGNTKTTQADRAAANRLANANSVESVIYIMQLVKQGENEQYMPSVGSVRQLEEKWVNILSFIRKKGQQQEIAE